MSMVMPPPPVEIREADPRNNERLQGSPQKIKSNMYLISREICVSFAIAVVVYAALLNSQPTEPKGPPAVPFFPRGSLVDDFYQGELDAALQRISESDLALVMYYAPWDADCQRVRHEFLKVAQFHFRQVYFAAINCWQPGSRCRTHFARVERYPVVIAYMQQGAGLQYRGPVTASHMVRFLDELIRPLHRIETTAQLSQLIASHHGVLVGFTPFVGVRGGPWYRAVYEAALDAAKRDYLRDIAYAIVTNALAAARIGSGGVHNLPSIRLYLWNETLEYAGPVSGEAVGHWTVQHAHSVTQCVSPPGTRSITLAPYIHRGPVLLLFTPRDPLRQHSPYLDILREIGLDYFNCDRRSTVSELAKYIANERAEKCMREQELAAKCAGYKRRRGAGGGGHHAVVVQSVVDARVGARNVTMGSKRRLLRLCLEGEGGVDWEVAGVDPPCTGRLFNSGASKVDELGASRLAEWHMYERCRRLQLALPLPASLPHNAPAPHLTGLACPPHNRTLSLVTLDSMHYAEFARGLGIRLNEWPDNTAALILSAKEEKVSILNGAVTKASLMQLVMEYSNGRAERYLRSAVEDTTTITAPPAQLSISLPELTAATFLPFVLNSSMSVVVLYHTPYCAFCHAASQVFLLLARVLRDIPCLAFARFNTEANDLPWHLTVHHLPSILFFPARRKSESRKFPHTMLVNMENVAQFVLANLPLEVRLVARIALCGQWGRRKMVEDDRRQCMTAMRLACLDAISDALAQYRSLTSRLQHCSVLAMCRAYRTARRRTLHRLGYLRQLHLLAATETKCWCLQPGVELLVRHWGQMGLMVEEGTLRHLKTDTATAAAKKARSNDDEL